MAINVNKAQPQIIRRTINNPTAAAKPAVAAEPSAEVAEAPVAPAEAAEPVDVEEPVETTDAPAEATESAEPSTEAPAPSPVKTIKKISAAKPLITIGKKAPAAKKEEKIPGEHEFATQEYLLKKYWMPFFSTRLFGTEAEPAELQVEQVRNTVKEIVAVLMNIIKKHECNLGDFLFHHDVKGMSVTVPAGKNVHYIKGEHCKVHASWNSESSSAAAIDVNKVEEAVLNKFYKECQSVEDCQKFIDEADKLDLPVWDIAESYDTKSEKLCGQLSAEHKAAVEAALNAAYIQRVKNKAEGFKKNLVNMLKANNA